MENEKRLDLIDRKEISEMISSLTMTITGLRAGKGVLNKFMTEYRKSILRIIDEAPTVDAVPVVRCKDCKKWEYDENFSGWCTEWRRRTLGDHFCSYGERREGE